MSLSLVMLWQHLWEPNILSKFDHVQIAGTYNHIWGSVKTLDVTLVLPTEAN